MEASNGSPTHRKTAPSNGLKQAVLSPNETLAQSVALIAPTAAPLLTVPLVYASAGQGSWLVFLISTLTIVFVALNINQFARMSASPGSLYTYISAHMHPVLGILAGWALLIAYIGTAIALCAGLTNYLNIVLKTLTGLQALPLLLAVISVGLASWLAYCDVKISARLMLGLEALSVALIAFVALSILVQHGFRPDMVQFKLQGATPEKLRNGLVLAIFCLVGFESATSLGSEAKDPLRSIPRAVKWSAILAGLFFCFCAYTEVLGFRGEAQTLDKSLAPIHVLARRAGLPSILGVLIDFGAVVNFFSCVLACITAAARVLFLMGRHGTLHSQLGEAHKSRQTPHRAVLLSSLATFTPLAILIILKVGALDIYGLTGTIATFGFLTAYILISVAAPIYLRALGRLNARDIAVSILAVLAMGTALLGSVYPVPPAPYSTLPYIYLALLLGGLIWSVVLKARSPLLVDPVGKDLNVLVD
jgi:amino acid transporter